MARHHPPRRWLAVLCATAALSACGGGGDDKGATLMERLRANGYAAANPKIDQAEALKAGRNHCKNATPGYFRSYWQFSDNPADEKKFVATAVHVLCPEHDDDVSAALSAD